MGISEGLWGLSYGQALGLGVGLVLLAGFSTLLVDYIARMKRTERRLNQLERLSGVEPARRWIDD